MYNKSVEDPAAFWSEIASEFYWKEKWNPKEVCKENLDVTKGQINIEVSVRLPSFLQTFKYYSYCILVFLFYFLD